MGEAFWLSGGRATNEETQKSGVGLTVDWMPLHSKTGAAAETLARYREAEKKKVFFSFCPASASAACAVACARCGLSSEVFMCGSFVQTLLNERTAGYLVMHAPTNVGGTGNLVSFICVTFALQYMKNEVKKKKNTSNSSEGGTPQV